jgi:hypothetical protein
MFKHSGQVKSVAEREHINNLLLLIEPTNDEQTELNQLRTQYRNHSQLALDASDPDPEGLAARMSMVATDLFWQERRRNERNSANAERAYRERSIEMKKVGIRR